MAHLHATATLSFDLPELFKKIDCSTSDLLEALALSVEEEELNEKTDDLKVAAIREAAARVKKIEESCDDESFEVIGGLF